MRIKLPADAICSAYTEISPCYWEPVFFSASCNFTGTKDEFYEAGFAYSYEDHKNGWRSLYFKYPRGS